VDELNVDGLFLLFCFTLCWMDLPWETISSCSYVRAVNVVQWYATRQLTLLVTVLVVIVLLALWYAAVWSVTVKCCGLHVAQHVNSNLAGC